MTTSRSDRRGRALALALVGVASGCTYTVRLNSVPAGASVTRWEGDTVVEQVTLPGELTLQRRVAGPVLLVVEAPGYRPLRVDMQRTEGPVLRWIGAETLQRGGREVTFVLEADRARLGEED